MITRNSFPALVRKAKGASVKLSYYNTIEKEIDDIKVDIPYEWYDTAHIEYSKISGYFASRMYTKLYYRENAIAVVLVGPSLLATITPSNIIIEELLYGKTVAVYSNILKIKYWDSEDIIPVGFEKEYPLSVEVFVPPGRVFYNTKTDEILRNGEWIKPKFKPVFCKSKQYYYLTLREEGECFAFDGKDMIKV